MHLKGITTQEMFGYLLFLSTLPHRVDRREEYTKQVHSSNCFPEYRMSGTAGQDTRVSSFLYILQAIKIVSLIPNPASNLELNEKSYFDQIKVNLVSRKSS